MDYSSLYTVRDKYLKYHIITAEVDEIISDLKKANAQQAKTLADLYSRWVNPPYNEELENTVRKRTQYLSDEINRLKNMLEEEKVFSDYLLKRLNRELE